MKVVQKTTPCYCTECDSPNAILVRWQNLKVIQNDGFAVCTKCADKLAQRLGEIVRRRRWNERKVAP